MKNLKWLLQLADTKPLIFAIGLLMLVTTSIYRMVGQRDEEILRIKAENILQDKFWRNREDSINKVYAIRELKLQIEVRATLNAIIEGYKIQLEDQKRISDRINNSLKKNRQIIKKAKK